MPCKFENCSKRAAYGYLSDKIRIYCNNHKINGTINLNVKFCEKEGCFTIATFGLKGANRKYCSNHKLKDMMDLTMRNCSSYGCDNRANFGLPDKSILYCNNHKIPGTINISAKLCETEGCFTIANFGLKGANRKYCSDHRSEGMVNLYAKKCSSPNCNIPARFGYPNKKIEKCKNHKMNGMIIIGLRKCEIKECTKLACSAFPGEKPKLCKSHSSNGMEIIHKKKCQFTGCNTTPVFGVIENKPEYCLVHKLANMKNVRGKKCQYENCNVSPCFGYKYQKSLYCRNHKLENMVNVMSRRCIIDGCDKIAYYGVSRSERCPYHKLDTDKFVDSKKLCVFPECKTKASVGKLFQTKSHCGKHKQPNEFNKNHPKCEVCSQDAYYTPNVRPFYPKRCEDHHKSDDINLVEKQCTSCHLCFIIPDNQNLCESCDGYNNKRYGKIKEDKIRNLFNANNILSESEDRRVDNLCSKYRPDFVIDYPLFKLVVEVDENQHRSYSQECEIRRMRQIREDLGVSRVVFIRFNPDSYKDKTGATQRAYGRRENTLLELMRTLKNAEVENFLTVYYLYYDGYDGTVSKTILDHLVV